ncbi:MAG TPA: RNA chaperone Hfq [Aquifex aeolicus]|uniref:RNA-binding protein Hfq n=1 Tax=Aquifex aeolicus TaxID=63363 RepID=A0A9D1CG43_AQUAO|nr:RNA chaperone Hfq [Aquificales bacterium]HIP98797.1 RNA chaperone Hfq [Aquifex aeolicus]HIQ25798.1 RNA chaperone Hfq [Aquifex aeolicus]
MEQNNQAILQDQLLNKAIEENKPVTVYLTRGNRITGYVKSFDRFCILLEVNGEEQLIFKHAVSTVVPHK